MCGIAGYIDYTGKAGDAELQKMTDALSYRGPDASGQEVFSLDKATLGLGHRRLSIIDLSPLGKQPMFTPDRKLSIIFNGEIYNYREIREELSAKGHAFISGSDTEVILHAYQQWGDECVKKFTGMFAFAIFDEEKQELFLSRDRAGVKPLYYYQHNGCFLFASELKAFFAYPGFEKAIDPQAFRLYVQYTFVPAPYTIFKHTWKLEPGCSMRVDLKNGNITQQRYWDVLDYYGQPKQQIGDAEAKEALRQRLIKACEYRMVSDVPVGMFLSGGYDSSLVTALLQSGRSEKIKTFTIGFTDAKYNEAQHAAKVAAHLGTDHHELYCSFDDAKAIIPELPECYDEPFADSSAIPTMLVSRFARKQVTVALSADGGDELFAGYERHAALLSIAAKKDKIPAALRPLAATVLRNTPKKVLNKIFSGNTSADNIAKYLDFLQGKTDLTDMIDFANQTAAPDTLAGLFTQTVSPVELFRKNEIRKLPGRLDQLLAFDYLSYLPGDILTKVDRATMHISLEGREPLLDHSLIEWIATLPDDMKYRNGVSKYLLRQIVHDYLPREIMERPKMGFSIPLVNWFRSDLRPLFDEHLSEKSLAQHGLLDHRQVAKLLNEYYSGDNYRFTLLWTLLMFQLWYKKWIQ